MNTTVQIIGVHKVKSKEPCYLVEIVINDSSERIDLGDFTQEMKGKKKSSWQVPYMEQYLEQDGTECPLSWMVDRDDPNFWRGNLRIAFFFHYLNLNMPLLTPFGKVEVPNNTVAPERLKFMRYPNG